MINNAHFLQEPITYQESFTIPDFMLLPRILDYWKYLFI